MCENMAISTAGSGVSLVPANQNMLGFRLPVFRHAQWPLLAAQKAQAAAPAQTACSLVGKIVLGLRAGVAMLLRDVVCLPGRFTGGLSIPSRPSRHSTRSFLRR